MDLGIFTGYSNGVGPIPPVVNTSYGRVAGAVEYSRSGESYYSFKGIPFAKPPLGDLRFRDPEPPEKWKGVRPATRNPIFCIQLMAILFPTLRDIVPPMGSEDCLYLSVSTRSLNPQANLPVLVYMHGGAFVCSAGPSITTANFIMDKNLVVVMAEYRLGTLGFLSFEDSVMPGNMGLKDQNMALRWVKENIHNFGGDPNRVTIMGESAGAASVHYHTMSPMSKGLFHQVIPLSGSAYALWAYAHPGDPRALAFQYGKSVGCKGNSTTVLKCMQKVPATKLVKATAQFWGVWDLEPITNIGPVFEKKRKGSFTLPSTKKWKGVSVPMLIADSSGEGLLKTLIHPTVLNRRSWKWISKNWDEVMPFSLRFSHNPKRKELAQKLKGYFFRGKTLLDDTDLTNFTNMYTVVGEQSASIRMAEDATNRVYYMKFGYLGELSPATMVNDPNFPKLTFHAEALLYILHWFFIPAFRGQDLEVSLELTEMIANFVIHGDPTPDTGLWQPWNNRDYATIVIDNNGTRMIREGLPEDVRFLRSLCLYEKFFGCKV